MSQLEALFPSKTMVSVLSLFLLNPEQEYYQSEVAQKTGLALLKVQNALKRLEKSGYVVKTPRGKMVYYRANRDQPGFGDLKQLFLKTVAIGDLIRTALEKASESVELAFIFGSYAKGNEQAASDIDLFILGDLSLMATSDILGAVTEATHREINPVIYSRNEFLKRYGEKNHFVRELVSSPKIWLIGDEHELGAVVG